MVKKKHCPLKMFVDYDNCIKGGKQKHCRSCSKAQQVKCQKKNG